MWQTIVAWRGELLTLAALLISWLVFRYRLKRNFWHMWIPGAILGLAVEFMTEPEWTYSLQCYLWRDISPFVIAGWGIVFTWLVTISDYCYRKMFGAPPGTRGPRDPRLWLTDIIVGIPLFLGNELFGLHIIKIWQYNTVLRWDTMIPLIDYPLEGLVAIICFSLAVPAAVRYWKGYK